MSVPLDSRQLRAFVSLAKHGSFSRAAEELNLSQSAVSHSVKALETDLGCRLLDRVGKRVSLNSAGEHFLFYAEKVLKNMGAARQSVEQVIMEGGNRLRVAAGTTACHYLLPRVLREFKDSFPRCQLSIEPSDSRKAISLIKENRVDVALSLEPEKETNVNFRPLFSDELQFLLHPDHPWVKRRHVVRDDLPRQTIILHTRTSHTYKLIEQYFKREDMPLNSVLELGNMEGIKAMVKLDLGIGVVAPWTARAELAAGTLACLRLGRRRLKRTWGITHLAGKTLNLVEECFVGLCQAACVEFKRAAEPYE